jgi:hypothetical protein
MSGVDHGTADHQRHSGKSPRSPRARWRRCCFARGRPSRARWPCTARASPGRPCRAALPVREPGAAWRPFRARRPATTDARTDDPALHLVAQQPGDEDSQRDQPATVTDRRPLYAASLRPPLSASRAPTASLARSATPTLDPLRSGLHQGSYEVDGSHWTLVRSAGRWTNL